MINYFMHLHVYIHVLVQCLQKENKHVQNMIPAFCV